MNHIFRMLTLLCLFSILLLVGIAVSAQEGDLCHVPPGNPENAHVIPAGDPSWDAHFAHGDFVIDGAHPCPPEDEEEPVDVCDNLDGNQESVPDGYYQSGDNCYPDEEEECPEVNLAAVVDNCEEEVDYCPNLEGDQESVPDGYVVNRRGLCVPEENGNGASAALPQTCIDAFHPFLAVNGFEPAARGYLVQNATWGGSATDLSQAWYVWLDIVPSARDSVRYGNDAGILCADAIQGGGPQIIAFRVLENGAEVTAGLVLVHVVDDSVVIDAATILRTDVLTPDPLWGGSWE